MVDIPFDIYIVSYRTFLTFDLGMKARLTRQKTLRGKCWTRAPCLAALVVVIVIGLNISAYSSWTSTFTGFHQYIRNISSRGFTFVGIGNGTNMTFGWMAPTRISNTRNVSKDSIILNGTTDIPSNITVPTTQSSLDAIQKEFIRTHLMTSQGNGRLGNQMFQFAALLGVSAMHGYTPFVSPGHRLTQVFDIRHTRVVTMVNGQGYGESRAGAFDTKIQNLSHAKNWTLQGYYQSWKYFSHVADDVRKDFRFKRDIYQKAFTKLNILKSNILVGVHIRRGDMNSKRELSRGYNVADETFISKAFDYFRSKFKHPKFVVIGDDMTWMRLKVKGKDITIATSGNAGVDLAIMAQCNHSIVTSGTFGWWGAFLAGGHTVYFRNYPKPGSWLDSQYSRADYYPSDWVGLS